MNILIVDDNKLNLLMAKNVIEESDITCSIILATSGEETINVIKSQHIDIILLDIIMPKMWGTEVLKFVKEIDKNIIVLMLTSVTNKKYLQKSFDLGATDYINKPIEPVEFISRLKAAIKLRKYQSALLESYENLKNMNSQLKESNNKLVRTQKELINREKLSAIGRFSAGIAHEINTPLGYIKSNLNTVNKYNSIIMSNFQKNISFIENFKEFIPDKEAIKKLYSDKEKIDFIFNEFDEIIKETNEGFSKITKIINNLIRFSNEDTYDSFQLNNFNEMLEEAIILINTELKDKKIDEIATLNINSNEEDILKCNRLEIEQALFNILINSIYVFNKENKIGNIYIYTYSDGSYFCCEIKDDGPGIEATIIDKIFDPFFTTKEIGEGVGLGLTTCYDIIVNKHKGLLSVKSVYGEGCTFFIKIPTET